MVRARLHIICGNCGCNDMFKFKIDPKGNDYGTHFEPSVVITCENCSTLHSLDGVIEEERSVIDEHQAPKDKVDETP